VLVELTEDDYLFVSKMMANRQDHEKICGTAFTYPLSAEKYTDYFVTNAGDKGNRLCFKKSSQKDGQRSRPLPV
jgi:hypothetical protein